MTSPHDPRQQVPYSPGAPAPQQYGYPATAAAPAARRRRRWPIVAGVLGAVLLLCCGGGLIVYLVTRDDDGQAGSNRPSATIGQAVRDGQFEFTVTTVQCGVPQVGAGVLAKKAQGQYCLITINIKNIGSKPRTFTDNSQKAFNTAGAEYAADALAGLSANPGAENLWTDVNPGNQVTGVVVFDIPLDAKLARLELHDSLLSGGVTVTI